MLLDLQLQAHPVSDLVSAAPRFPIEKIGTWLSAVLQSSLDGVIVINAKGKIVLVNREAQRMFAYPASVLLGEPFQRLLSPDMHADFKAQVAHFAAAKAAGRRLRIQVDMQGRRADDEAFLMSTAISRLTMRGEIFLVLILRELQACIATTYRATMPQTKLHSLAISSQQAREIEKRQFSRELYDDIGQRLSVLKLDLDWLESMAPSKGDIAHRITQMQHLLDHTISQTKALASTLRPALLDDFGLLPAVEWMATKLEKRTGIHCTLHSENFPTGLDEQVESAIFRIVQESLSNIEKHAKASRVTMQFWHADRHLHLQICDDGIGLAPNSRKKTGCHGLIMMQERIYVLGGILRIQNNETRGVKIHASVPFQS